MPGSHFVCYNFKIKPLYPGCEILIAQLSELGFDSFQENNDGISAYIDSTILSSVNFEDIQILNSTDFDISFEFYNVKKQNWNIKWESNFEPIYVDETCCVRAPFHKKSNYKYDLVIEPKMSFGTGHHETTSMMISYLLEDDFVNCSVCDVGCGTGILAILAEKKGASSLDAIDIDNWCYLNSLENIKRNNSKKIKIFEGEISLLRNNNYDKIFANINLNVLLKDISIYSKLLNSGGILYLSGFYKKDTNKLLKEANKFSMKLVGSKESNNWTCIKLIKS
jgi:ribosomal protein L11 methyltransferase